MDGTRVVTNRPLAGTRRRGDTPSADLAMEQELLGDEKERAEHVMLVGWIGSQRGRGASERAVGIGGLRSGPDSRFLCI